MVAAMKTIAIITGIALLAAGRLPARAEVHPSKLFSDHMVVQQGKPIPVWGTADPGETIAIDLGPDHAKAVADSTGNWAVSLAPLQAQPGNAPLKLTFKGAGPEVVVQDVLVGEVWLASGQSNMTYEMSAVVNAKQEIAAANHPDIRMFTVGRNGYSPLPVQDVAGSWVVATPATIVNFSAVAYYFALKLETALHVPIGIINSSRSGSPIKAWTSLRALASVPAMQLTAGTEVDHAVHFDDEMKAFLAARPAWESQYGIRDTTADDARVLAGYVSGEGVAWKPSDFPVKRAANDVKTGAVTWFRGSFLLDAATAAATKRVNAGVVRESCILWINGTRVGDYGLKMTDPAKGDLVFNLPAGLLKAGSNTIVLRIFAHDADLTMLGSKPVVLENGDGTPFGSTTPQIEWQRATEVKFPAVDAGAAAAYPQPPRPMTADTSTVLYRSMIEPLRDYSIRGAIWYQGESNAGQQEYREQLPLMVEDWRRQWHDSWPFYLVQLPNFGVPGRYDPDRSPWAVTREIQQQIVASLPNSALAVTIDTGDPKLLHPPNKKPVGERLALLALARTYKLPVHDSGPTYVSYKVDGGKIRVVLANADGLHSPNTPLEEFAVAGADKKFHPAVAMIDGTSLVVSSPDVLHPVAVRYAYTDGPEKADIYNADGLPLAPFRTDDWQFPAK